MGSSAASRTIRKSASVSGSVSNEARMATLNFDESVVLILFAQAVGKSQPSKSELEQFDSDLQNTFGQKLLTVFAAEGMDANVHNRSAVLGCRPHVPGNTAESQLRNACRYVLHAQKELGSLAIAAFQALASPEIT